MFRFSVVKTYKAVRTCQISHFLVLFFMRNGFHQHFPPSTRNCDLYVPCIFGNDFVAVNKYIDSEECFISCIVNMHCCLLFLIATNIVSQKCHYISHTIFHVTCIVALLRHPTIFHSFLILLSLPNNRRASKQNLAGSRFHSWKRYEGLP